MNTINTPLEKINAVWIGSQIGPVHASCLRSFANRGHEVNLFTYGTIADPPGGGVRILDASMLIPRSDPQVGLLISKPAFLSDILRYEIQRQNLGLYVDCDCFCLRPIAYSEYIFGMESDEYIANGVLKLAHSSSVVEDLCSVRHNKRLNFPWISRKRRLFHSLRRAIGKPITLADLPWGMIGPRALTWHVKQAGLMAKASPIDDFYYLHHQQTSLLFDPQLTIQDLVTSRSRILHLSHEKLRRRMDMPVPENCALQEVLEQ